MCKLLEILPNFTKGLLCVLSCKYSALLREISMSCQENIEASRLEF